MSKKPKPETQQQRREIRKERIAFIDKIHEEKKEQEDEYSGIVSKQFFVTDSKATKELLKYIIREKSMSVNSKKAEKKLKLSQIRLAKSATELKNQGLVEFTGRDPSNPDLTATDKLKKLLKIDKQDT